MHHAAEGVCGQADGEIVVIGADGYRDWKVVVPEAGLLGTLRRAVAGLQGQLLDGVPGKGDIGGLDVVGCAEQPGVFLRIQAALDLTEEAFDLIGEPGITRRHVCGQAQGRFRVNNDFPAACSEQFEETIHG